MAKAKNASRRRAAQPLPASGRRFNWVMALIAAAVAAIAGVVLFVVMQAGGSDDTSAAIAAEADASTSLPGEYINLPLIYGGPYSDTAGHVTEAVDYTSDCAEADPALCNTNPPVGGPHWSGSCGEDPSNASPFCGPAPWGIYTEPWDPETLVHNMEHGGAIIWYNSEDQQVIADLQALVEERLRDDDIIVLAPYPDLENETIALTGWTRLDKFPVSEFSDERVQAFLDAHVRRFNPEHF